MYDTPKDWRQIAALSARSISGDGGGGGGVLPGFSPPPPPTPTNFRVWDGGGVQGEGGGGRGDGEWQVVAWLAEMGLDRYLVILVTHMDESRHTHK